MNGHLDAAQAQQIARRALIHAAEGLYGDRAETVEGWAYDILALVEVTPDQIAEEIRKAEGLPGKTPFMIDLRDSTFRILRRVYKRCSMTGLALAHARLVNSFICDILWEPYDETALQAEEDAAIAERYYL